MEATGLPAEVLASALLCFLPFIKLAKMGKSTGLKCGLLFKKRKQKKLVI